MMRGKLGLSSEDAGDTPLIDDLLQRLALNQVDYTVFFRALCAAAEDPAADAGVAALFEDPSAFHGLCRALAATARARARGARSARACHAPVQPRLHPAQSPHRASDRGRRERQFRTVRDARARARAARIEEQPEFAHLAEPPLVSERVSATFCGT